MARCAGAGPRQPAKLAPGRRWRPLRPRHQCQVGGCWGASPPPITGRLSVGAQALRVGGGGGENPPALPLLRPAPSAASPLPRGSERSGEWGCAAGVAAPNHGGERRGEARRQRWGSCRLHLFPPPRHHRPACRGGVRHRVSGRGRGGRGSRGGWGSRGGGCRASGGRRFPCCSPSAWRWGDGMRAGRRGGLIGVRVYF